MSLRYGCSCSIMRWGKKIKQQMSSVRRAAAQTATGEPPRPKVSAAITSRVASRNQDSTSYDSIYFPLGIIQYFRICLNYDLKNNSYLELKSRL